MSSYPAQKDNKLTTPRRGSFQTLSMAVVGVLLVLWSLLAGGIYLFIDPIFGWVAQNAGLLVDFGRDASNLSGVESGPLIDSLNLKGWLGQLIALLWSIAKPALIVIWAVGAGLLLVAPLILRKLGSLLSGSRG